MKAEEAWGHKARMQDVTPEFPLTFYFHDLETGELQKATVSKEAWDNTLKTFEDNDKVSNHVIQKYLSKHED